MEYQDLTKFKVPAGFRGKSGWYVQLWWLVQQWLVQSSPHFMYGWRRFWLRAFGARIGKGVLLRPSVHVWFPWKVSIGDHSWVGDNVGLYSIGEICIGSHVVVSQRSYLCAGGHDYKQVDFPVYVSPITIKDQAWIAADVYIAPGVTVGKGAVVGARSSVFSSIEGGYVYAGTPLTKRKQRPRKGTV